LQALRDNIKRGLFQDRVDHNGLEIVQGRLILHTSDSRATDCLSKAFGIVSFSPATEIRADLADIRREALALYNEHRPATFRVTSQRLTKEFPMTSIEINCSIGDAICGCGGTVDLENHEMNIGIEVIKGRAYVLCERFKGPGGLPYGVQGSACAIVRNYRDFLSALLFMKRGCRIDLVVLNSPMAANYIDILQSYSFEGLDVLLVEKEREIVSAIKRYMERGLEVFVSGDEMKMPEGAVNLCPTELYSPDMARSALRSCNILSLPEPVENHRVSAGCTVFYKDTVLLLRRADEKTWVLPKGGVDSMEFFSEAAMREVCEESGICSQRLMAYIGKTRYSASDMHGPFTKDVYYYLSVAKDNDVHLEHIFDSYTFLPVPEAMELLSFENDRKILRSAERIFININRNV